MEKVSVIVPVYNTEKYIRECIESILTQTYPEIQIILVDDGSTDHSLDICKEYEGKNTNIEVYHQENKGVSAARNTGLKHVKGEYIFFVDSDDYILPQYIEDFMKLGDYPFIGGGYTEAPPSTWQYRIDDCVLSMDEFKDKLKENFQRIPSVHVAGNRYKTRIIYDNHLLFNENCRCGEDLRFNVSYFSCIQELCALSKCNYIYRIHPESAIHQFWPDRLREEREECQEREKLLGSSRDFDLIRYTHWTIALDHYYQYRKAEEIGKIAEQQLKRTVWDPYFRKCMLYAFKNGTKDMKLAVVCMFAGSYKLYRAMLTLIINYKRNRGSN